MRPTAFSLALLTCALLTPGTARAADDALDDIVERARKAFKVPGAAVVVVKDDAVVYLKGFGVRKQGTDEKVTPDTAFAIASCTKAFTATLMAMLAEEKKLSWDDKVRKHLDWFRLSDELADREVTLRDLICHRSGMPRHDLIWAGQTPPSTEALVRRWCLGKPSTSFRSTWEYSNVPFAAGGLIAGKLDGSDWAAATRRRIFTPLGMTSSYCTAREALATKDHATPHYLGLDGTIHAVEWDHIEAARPAGSIASTARDLGNWLRFHLAEGKFGGKQLLAAKALRETHTPQMILRPTGYMEQFFPPHACKFTAYGLGWIVQDHRGHLCVSHGGTLTGFRAQCMMVPDRKIGVVVLGNLRPSLFPESVARSVLDHLLGLPAEDWLKWHLVKHAENDVKVVRDRKKREKDRKPDTRPSLLLAGYAGAYREPAYGTATVSVEGDRLTLRWGKYVYRLEHHHFDTFTAVLTEPKAEVPRADRSTQDVQFRLSKAGEVESMTLYDQTFAREKKGG